MERCRNKLDILEHLIIRLLSSPSVNDTDLYEAIKLSNECSTLLDDISKHSDETSKNEISDLCQRFEKAKNDILVLKSDQNKSSGISKYMDSLERGKDTSALLDQFIASIESCQKQGNAVLEDLDQQRMTLNQMNDDLDSIDGIMDKSSKVLKSMARKAFYNKFVLLVLICVLIILITVDIDVFYIKHPNKPR